MRNLFLRGYHGAAEEQLSGEVGARQEATEHPGILTSRSSTSSNGIVINLSIVEGTVSGSAHADTGTVANLTAPVFTGTSYMNKPTDGRLSSYTSRPVNMAVLYCVKAQETAEGEDAYSTEETRIGTWIDGKPVYRRVIKATTPGADTGGGIVHEVENIDTVVDIRGVYTDGLGNQVPAPFFLNEALYAGIYYGRGNIYVNVKGPSTQNRPITIFMEYTKTTD